MDMRRQKHCQRRVIKLRTTLNTVYITCYLPVTYCYLLIETHLLLVNIVLLTNCRVFFSRKDKQIRIRIVLSTDAHLVLFSFYLCILCDFMYRILCHVLRLSCSVLYLLLYSIFMNARVADLFF